MYVCVVYYEYPHDETTSTTTRSCLCGQWKRKPWWNRDHHFFHVLCRRRVLYTRGTNISLKTQFWYAEYLQTPTVNENLMRRWGCFSADKYIYKTLSGYYTFKFGVHKNGMAILCFWCPISAHSDDEISVYRRLNNGFTNTKPTSTRWSNAAESAVLTAFGKLRHLYRYNF